MNTTLEPRILALLVQRGPMTTAEIHQETRVDPHNQLVRLACVDYLRCAEAGDSVLWWVKPR